MESQVSSTSAFPTGASFVAPQTPRGRGCPFAPPMPFPILQSSVVTLKDQEIAFLKESVQTRDARIGELETQVTFLTNRMAELEMQLLSSAKPVPAPEPTPMPLGESVDLTNVPIVPPSCTKTPVKAPVKYKSMTSPVKSLRRFGQFNTPNARIPAERTGTASTAVRAASLGLRAKTPRGGEDAWKRWLPAEYKADATDPVDVFMGLFFASYPTQARLCRINKGFYRVYPEDGENFPTGGLPFRGEFEADFVNGVVMVRAAGWNNDKRGRVQRLFKDFGL